MNVSPIKNGELVYGLEREKYDDLSRLNFSRLKHMKESPAHVLYAMNEAYEDTDAKKVGRCVHLASLEAPEVYRARIAVWDLGRRSGKDWEAFKERNQGSELLTENEYELVTNVSTAIRSNHAAMKWLSGGRSEATMLWTHVAPKIGELEGYSIDCKGRVDFVSDLGALVDLKVTRNPLPQAFGRAAVDYDMVEQAAWYLDAFERITGKRYQYKIVAAENTPPFTVVVFNVPDRLLRLGRDKVRTWLDQYNFCRLNNAWPGPATDEVDLELPHWADPGAEDDPEAGLGLVGL